MRDIRRVGAARWTLKLGLADKDRDFILLVVLLCHAMLLKAPWRF